MTIPAVAALALGLALFLLAGKLASAAKVGSKVITSLGLVVILAAFFALLVEVGPTANASSWQGIALFAGTAAVVRLMTFFETAR